MMVQEINQTASLTNGKRLNNAYIYIYINDLIWTNDNQTTSGKNLPNSIWFKIMAFKTKAYQSQDDNLIIVQYQFITTLVPKLYIGMSSANWNLQTTSLVINPKS